MQWGTLVVLVALTAVSALVWRTQQGRLRMSDGASRPARAGRVEGWAGPLAALGVEPGERATFLQYSAEVCSSCRATARTLGALAEAETGVVHVEIDVDTHPELVRSGGIMRTPTVLVLDPAGAERARSSGAMTPAQARTALAAVTPVDQTSGRKP